MVVVVMVVMVVVVMVVGLTLIITPLIALYPDTFCIASRFYYFRTFIFVAHIYFFLMLIATDTWVSPCAVREPV
jgi:hypothetical protein